MKIKHWQGYGSVNATRVKDKNVKLHIRVVGNHEYGIHRDDEYDLYYWLVRRFDKNIQDPMQWHWLHPQITIIDGIENDVDTCDYLFDY